MSNAELHSAITWQRICIGVFYSRHDHVHSILPLEVSQADVELELDYSLMPHRLNLVISEAVFTANHLTDTDKQNSTGKYAN